MAIISLAVYSTLTGMLQWAFRQRDETGKRLDVMAESLFNNIGEEQNSKFLWEKNIGEKVHSKRNTSQCAIEGKNLLSALLKQILKGNNNLHLYNS